MSRPVLFDSHLHLTATKFDEDRDAVISRARETGVDEMVTIASNPTDGRDAIAIAASDDGIWATAGLHPHDASQTSAATLGEIERLAANDRVVAIGETGLDFFYDNSPRDPQLENFEAHLALAERLSLPIVVHSRDADADTIAFIREFAGRVTGVLHCFAAGRDLLDAGIDADWYVSFSGLATFVPEIADAARVVPEDRILIETDSPYLAPAPKRGRRNEPSYLVHTCASVAELRGVSVEELAATTRRNARRFYRLEAADGRAEA